MLAAAVLLSGCVVGSTDEPSADPRRDLAATPQSLPPGSALPGSPGASLPGASSAPASGAPSSGASSAPAAGGRSSAPAPGYTRSAAPGAPYRVVGTRSDRSRDAGGTTPGYADLLGVTIEDNGANARVTMRFAAPVPTKLPADETIGTGVDFYRNALQTESDYQLFADGQPDGWYAYLHTPKGFVKYPGTFGIGGDRLVFTVPWSALGSPTKGDFSAFTDWTRSATPSNLAGEDYLPDIGHATYSR